MEHLDKLNLDIQYLAVHMLLRGYARFRLNKSRTGDPSQQVDDSRCAKQRQE